MTKDELRSTGEALIALSEGKEIEYKMNGLWTRSSMDISTVLSLIDDDVPYRVRVLPRMRPIRVDELPYCFVIREDENDMHPCSIRRTFADAEAINRWIDQGTNWTDDGITWNRFEKEVTE